MASNIQLGPSEAAFFQSEIQRELVARGKAEEGDNTMAEYIKVMMLNNKSLDAIEAELRDLQQDDFDPSFTPWLFARSEAIKSGRIRASTSLPAIPSIATGLSAAAASTELLPAPQPIQSLAQTGTNARTISGNSRLLSNALTPIASGQRGGVPSGPSNALAGTKRGFSPVSGSEAFNKRRSLGNGASTPSGLRVMQGGLDEDGDLNMDGEGQRGALADRIGGRALNPAAGEFAGGALAMGGRGGMGNGRGGFRNPHFMNRNNFNPQQHFLAMQQQQQMMNGGFGMQPSTAAEALAMQEVMRQQQEQMFAMQLMMNQMVQAVQAGAATQQASATPAPITSQPPQKLGSHTISGRRPGPPPTLTGKNKSIIAGPLPDKPLSVELCKFGVGCTSARCTFSHPSPVATVLSGMVLKTEACPKGRDCDDPDCPFSHVSPAQKHGESAGVSRVLCKFPVCTNPSCQYRHEDADGNPIPSPALSRTTAPIVDTSPSAQTTAIEMDDHDDVDVRMDTESSTSGLAAGTKTPLTAEQRKVMIDSPLKDAAAKNGSIKAKPISTLTKPLNGTIPVVCKFGAGCTNRHCKFIHETKKPCHFGAKCFKEDCPYAHPPGRNTSSIIGDPFRQHKPSAMSQRKFQEDSNGTVEKITPGQGLAVQNGITGTETSAAKSIAVTDGEGAVEVEAIRRGEVEIKME